MVSDTALKFATRDGVKLAYVDTGTGDPPLLLVHGWCCDHTYWRDQIPEFAKRQRVVAVDLRGLGESDVPDEDSSIELFRDDVAWLSREIGLERPVIIGHSMGGLIALNVVRRQPELARAAVFVDAATMPFPAEFAPTVSSMLDGLRSPDYREVAGNFVGDFLFRPESVARLKDEIIKGMTGAPQRVMRTAMASIVSTSGTVQGPVPVPSVFVRAATYWCTEEQLKDAYPGMKVTTVDAAHFVQMEAPEEFNRILSRFLEGLA